ncbi:MAG: undecaprenyl-diphosphate phosphatase [archaeon]
MNWLYALILGIVQGITEWLPISSSGHLAIFQTLLNTQPGLFFDVAVHLASLFVVILVFRKEIKSIYTAFYRKKYKSEEAKLLYYILIASIPIFLIGYFLHDPIESLFSNLTAVGIALLLTGTLLFSTKFAKPKKNLNLFNTFIIGISQAIAIIPGISRSGATVSTGLLQGIEKQKVIRFSFLLFIPAVLAAIIYEASRTTIIEVNPVLIGFFSAGIVGFFSLKLLLNLIKKDHFWKFSIYCWILGLILLLV